MIIQIVATGIILVVLGQLAIRVIRDKSSFTKLALWVIFWSLSLFIIWLPREIIDNFGEFTGVGRGVDVLVYLSIIFLFYNNVRVNEKIDKLEQRITKLTREISKKNV